MSAGSVKLTGARIFDGAGFLEGHGLVMAKGRVQALAPERDLPQASQEMRLQGGVICPGFVDLQVNGGGGVMFNDAPSLATLRTMATAHARIGATSFLPTLITDTAAQMRAAVAATAEAISLAVPGIAGLHLEGPFLALARKGAHDPALIRPMGDADLNFLLAAAGELPLLKVTLAPETVSERQIRTLADAGILVSLGHSDATYEICAAAARLGARCVTHLFNAQSPLGSRAPGLVGAALELGELSAGLIADGHHVHPAAMAVALRAKRGPGQIFLVSDAMATAGSDCDGFRLNGRLIRRAGNRLTLQDGTLAGAHLELADAVRNIVACGGADFAAALSMATRVPAALIARPDIGVLTPGGRADALHLDDSGRLVGVWQGGAALALI